MNFSTLFQQLKKKKKARNILTNEQLLPKGVQYQVIN